jgi:hypothetical protein
MAKKRKRTVAKAARKPKSPRRTAGAKRKAIVAAKRRKVAARKQTKPVAKKKPAGKAAQKSLLKNVEEKVANAVNAVLDTLVDAEQLHHKLEPEVSREPE